MASASRELADAAQLSSLADETPEGRSIVVLAKEKYGIRERHVHELDAHFVPFSAQTRMSGVNLDGQADPQGRGRRNRTIRQLPPGGRSPPTTLARRRIESPRRAARRWSSPAAATCWA